LKKILVGYCLYVDKIRQLHKILNVFSNVLTVYRPIFCEHQPPKLYNNTAAGILQPATEMLEIVKFFARASIKKS
jgi:hypothetical protein